MANIIILDDNIIDIILKLNLKGYTTMFSCGGHVGQENTEVYIVIKRTEDIDRVLDEHLIAKLPDGFTIDVQDGNTTYNELKAISQNDWIENYTPEFFHRITIRTKGYLSDLMYDDQSIIDNCVDKLSMFVDSLPPL